MTSRDGPDLALSRHLSSLKRRGCAVLLVEDPGAGAHTCRRLAGAPELTRRRLFVPVDVGTADVFARHEVTDPDPARLGVVDAATAARRPVTAAGRPVAGPDPTAAWYDALDSLTDLDDCLDAATDHLDRFAAHDPAPAEVRCCLEGLDPLVDAVPEPDLFAFLHAFTRSVRAHAGMAHVHCSGAVPESTRETLEPLFDVVVETRADGDDHRERWRLVESGYETGWLSLGQ